MSYARSPRPVCSITIGTSIICSFKGCLSHSCPMKQLAFKGRIEEVRSRGLVVQKVESFFAADSSPDSIEGSILRQTRANRFRSLFRLRRQRYDLPVNLLITDFDFFFFRDLVEQHGSLYFLHRLVTLSRAQAVEIHFLDIFLAHALRCQCPQAALEADINLVFY